MILEAVEYYTRKMMEQGLELDLSDPSLKDTPARIARMYKEVFKGLWEEGPGITEFPNHIGYDGIVMSDMLDFHSFCEHHFLPFSGYCWILYIPNKLKVVGYSKFSRVLHYFAARPQLQERLVMQVADYIMKQSKPEGVMVYARAKHGCAQCRGAKQGTQSGMTTSVVRGVFAEDNTLEHKGMEMIKISLGLEGV